MRSIILLGASGSIGRQTLDVMKKHYIPYLMTKKDENTGFNTYNTYTVRKTYITKDGEKKVYQNARLEKRKPKKFDLLEADGFVKQTLENMNKGALFKMEALDQIWDHVNATHITQPNGKEFTYEQILNWIYRK